MRTNVLQRNQNHSLKNKYASLYSLAFQRRYKGARYLDPKTSRWMSADPALGEYIPGAPVNDDVRKANQNLPGMGGVFNTVNLHLYHYAGNNPVKYTDPTGMAAGDPFDTMDDAAKDFAETYNDDSIRNNKEYGSSIYKNDDGTYSYTEPKVGGKGSVSPSVHPEKETLATVHTHGREEDGQGNKDRLSEYDVENADKSKLPIYGALPSGTLEKYDPNKPMWERGDILGTNFPNTKNSETGQDDPTIGFFGNIKNHLEHNKNFPEQKKSWYQW